MIKINGGLFIATKHDILNYYEYNFKKTSGEDYLSNKGVLSCNIQIENKIFQIVFEQWLILNIHYRFVFFLLKLIDHN